MSMLICDLGDKMCSLLNVSICGRLLFLSFVLCMSAVNVHRATCYSYILELVHIYIRECKGLLRTRVGFFECHEDHVIVCLLWFCYQVTALVGFKKSLICFMLRLLHV